MDSLENARALYTFEEDPGNVIRNRAASSAPNLLIPQTFRRFRPEWLAFPHPLKHSDIRDAIVNIMGFNTVWLLLIFVSTNHWQLFTKTRTLVRSPYWRIDEHHDRDYSSISVHQHESFQESSRTLIEHRHSVASTIEMVPEYSKETEKSFIGGASAS